MDGDRRNSAASISAAEISQVDLLDSADDDGENFFFVQSQSSPAVAYAVYAEGHSRDTETCECADFIQHGWRAGGEGKFACKHIYAVRCRRFGENL